MREAPTCSCGGCRRAHAEGLDVLMRSGSTSSCGSTRRCMQYCSTSCAGRYADSGYWRGDSTLLAGRCAAPFGIEVAMRTFLIHSYWLFRRLRADGYNSRTRILAMLTFATNGVERCYYRCPSCGRSRGHREGVLDVLPGEDLMQHGSMSAVGKENLMHHGSTSSFILRYHPAVSSRSFASCSAAVSSRSFIPQFCLSSAPRFRGGCTGG